MEGSEGKKTVLYSKATEEDEVCSCKIKRAVIMKKLVRDTKRCNIAGGEKEAENSQSEKINYYDDMLLISSHLIKQGEW